MDANKLQVFENKHMMAFIELRDIEQQKKALENRDKEIREILAKGMEENGIESIDNEYVRITYIAPTTSESLDTKKLKANDPGLFHELMGMYKKITNKKGYTRITVK